MASEQKLTPEQINTVWSVYLNTGNLPDFLGLPWYESRRMRMLYSRLPDSPRCRLCRTPFKGIGGTFMRHVFGVVPSHLNPQICNHCEQFAERFQGGTEVQVSMLFADVRGSTKLAEKMNPMDFSRLINHFYNTATRVLFDANAMVEKLIGDAVTGFFTPGFSGLDHARVAVDAARQILRATGHESPEGPWIPVGIGVHTGLAYVGAVNSDTGLTEVAVLGDTPNIGARLASLARQGEIYISQATAQAAGLDSSGAQIHSQMLKGRTEPIEVWVLSTTNPAG